MDTGLESHQEEDRDLEPPQEEEDTNVFHSVNMETFVDLIQHADDTKTELEAVVSRKQWLAMVRMGAIPEGFS